MNLEIELPDLGPDGGDTAAISEWHFEEGEHLDKGDVLLEAISEADTVEIPCPASGVLVERLVEEDDIVRTGDPVALIETDEDVPDLEEA